MFMTHMDTVPLCAGAKPADQGRKIVNTVKTALGGDNRTGCAVLVTLAAELARAEARPSADHAVCSACARKAACGARASSTRAISATP